MNAPPTPNCTALVAYETYGRGNGVVEEEEEHFGSTVVVQVDVVVVVVRERIIVT